ncbi:uncharacterized protein PHACADRAFT_261860 [Phanerochaete carnosa HHB-10118-sp]|uniref:Uncharacterized protein n=1 Tax=Phanerochaete carnosa (strain HHB-10118-sp) TaxID=650164 RepID=K5VYC7_PHACS|nr:uncharacterized protein PHACADRAFT_261860 [Phanerochaete carnosa HHB-10118-sp]EKM51614.1 hypothetical protein PHACADRAFT_261860 [Phanerochaete carnosa HHB-10118-sp]
MAFWFRRERKRVGWRGRRDAENPPSGSYRGPAHDAKVSVYTRGGERGFSRRSLINQKSLPNTPTIASWGMNDNDPATLNIRNPPYTRAALDLASPVTPESEATPTSFTSMGRGRPPSIPIPMYTPNTAVNPLDETPRDNISITEHSRGTLSLTSDEIENILDMATIYSAPATPGTLRSSILQGVLPSPMPSFMVSQDSDRVGGVAREIPPPRPSALPALSIPSASTPGLLTPMTASTRREPPHAQLPSSPTPSTPGFRRSIDAASTRPSSIGNWDFITPNS